MTMSIDQTFSHLLDMKRSVHLERASPLFWRNVLTTTFAPVHLAILKMDRTVCARFGRDCGVDAAITSPDEWGARLHVVVTTPKKTHRVSFDLLEDSISSSGIAPSAWAYDASKFVEWLEDHVANLFKQFKPNRSH